MPYAPYPAFVTVSRSFSGEVSRSSYCTVASPAESDTLTSPTPPIPFSARVTVVTQPPQFIPVTIRCSVCMGLICWSIFSPADTLMNEIYVLHSFRKTTQKTSNADLDLATKGYRELAKELSK